MMRTKTSAEERETVTDFPGLSDGPDNWYHEKESAWLYVEVAAAEPDPRKSRLFLRLAAPLSSRREAGCTLPGKT